MDSDFLKCTVGMPLSLALSKMVLAQPEDPVEFLGNTLLDYVQRKERKWVEELQSTSLNIKLKEHEENLALLKQAEIKTKEIQAAEQQKETDAELELNSSRFHKNIYSVAVNMLHHKTSATSVYLAKKICVEDRYEIQYLAEAPSTTGMIGKKLIGGLKGQEDEEQDDETGEEGVTFRLWKKTEQPPPCPPQYDEDGELIEDDKEPELIFPEHIHIYNVIREPKMKFFGVPKIGGYVSVPVTYLTWLHPEGIVFVPAAEKEEMDEAVQETGDNDDDEENEGTIQPLKGEGGKKGETPSKEIVPARYEKQTIPAYLSICMHTMGQGVTFTDSHLEICKRWASMICSALERVEDELFKLEVGLVPMTLSLEGAAFLKDLKGDGAKKEVEEALATLAEDATLIRKSYKEASVRYKLAVNCVIAHSEAFKALNKQILPPSTENLSILKSCMRIFGLSIETKVGTSMVIDPQIDAWWDEESCLQRIEFMNQLKIIDPTDPDKAEGIEKANTELEEVEVDAALGGSSSLFGSLLHWVRSAKAFSEGASAKRNEDEELAAAKAEAEAAALLAKQEAETKNEDVNEPKEDDQEEEEDQ